ncbi:hypothetical protein [Pedobacter caeni]|uniref:Uncharacterized protein n=1 Tax=Pedobacter caeni TaxID=288992 RepID=A0A1M4WKJ0_9SPHI|nr:hypothetical protein [Pedobacter caeni]SHE81821.1 hypothetical protein SAMN04488522_1011298 [Pedobacter caeni]
MEGSKKRNPYKTNAMLLVVIGGLFLLTHLFHFAFRNTIDQPPTPAQYAAYLPLDSGAKNAHLELKSLFANNLDRGRLLPPLMDPVTGMVMLNTVKEETNYSDGNVYYRLDSSGRLVDSLLVEDYYISLNREYIIHPNYYYSWFLDGHQEKREYLPVNEDLKLGTKALQQRYETLYRDAELVQLFGYQMLWGNGTTEREKRKYYDTKTDKAIFLIRNKWYALYGKDLKTMPGGEKKKSLDTIRQLNLDQLGVPNPYLYVANFRKDSKGYEGWDGTAYLNIMMGKDTLKVSTGMTLNESVGKQPPKYVHSLEYFRGKTMPFAIICKENNRCYILKSN